jgi:hypothetical protein
LTAIPFIVGSASICAYAFLNPRVSSATCGGVRRNHCWPSVIPATRSDPSETWPAPFSINARTGSNSGRTLTVGIVVAVWKRTKVTVCARAATFAITSTSTIARNLRIPV